MEEPIAMPMSRRSLISRAAPALAVGSTLLAAAEGFAADAAPTAKPKSLALELLAKASANGENTQPPQPYAYDALEPHIDAATMTLHHDKHHAAYVAGLNKAIKSLAKVRENDELDPATLAGLTRDVSFNAGGHIFHTLFWATMGKPTGAATQAGLPVLDAINTQYGGLDGFKKHFGAVAAGIKGSGWAIAFYEPVADKILIAGVGDQDERLIPTAMPILLIDVWEHAYYLKYNNVRANYIKAWWNVVNWAEVDALYAATRQMSGRA